MIERIFAKIGLADTHADLLRNIVSLRRSEDLFDDLSPDPMHWDAAIRLELASKPPMLTANQPVINRPFEEAAWNDAIAYPFKHWMRSRYSKGNFGIWYGADSIETSVHETVYHWRHGLLADAGFTQAGIKIERKIYQVRCDAALNPPESLDQGWLVCEVGVAIAFPAEFLVFRLGRREGVVEIEEV